MSDRVRVRPHDDGAIWQVTFENGKGNILDRATMGGLRKVFEDARVARGLKAICIEGAGENFSFGASVQEHQPDQVRSMLAELRLLVFALLDSHVTVVAGVRGQCLGGGLELAALCHRVFAHSTAKFGQPEIALGIFPPLASIVLPERIGRPKAEELCLTGRSVSAADALDMGLIDDVSSGDPVDAALVWARTHLLRHSASSLRLAVEAVRANFSVRLRDELPAIEKLYLERLMATNDAPEGLRAFLEKRPARWTDS